MTDFILNLQFIFMPHYWLMHQKYRKDIDDLMQCLLDNYEFTDVTEYTAKLGDVEIWIANRPYACMTPYGIEHIGRPSRLTIKRGLKKLNFKVYKERFKQEKIERVKSISKLCK